MNYLEKCYLVSAVFGATEKATSHEEWMGRLKEVLPPELQIERGGYEITWNTEDCMMEIQQIFKKELTQHWHILSVIHDERDVRNYEYNWMIEIKDGKIQRQKKVKMRTTSDGTVCYVYENKKYTDMKEAGAFLLLKQETLMRLWNHFMPWWMQLMLRVVKK